jgi:signal transduction histidine kinase
MGLPADQYHAEMSYTTSYLADLVRINDALSWSPEGAASFVAAVAIVKDVMGARFAPSYVLNASEDLLVLVGDDEQRAVLGESFASMPAHEHVRAPWVNAEEWPVSAADHLDDEAWALLPDDFKAWFGDSGIVASLHADGRHLGAVLLCFDGPFTLDSEQRDFLAAAGRILGSALCRWQMAGRERELGALQERRRLSDELHVDLSQQVAALGLHVGLTKLDVAERDLDRLADDIAGLDGMVATLKMSLRHQMLGLRADAEILGDSFLEQARVLVEKFAQQFGIAATFDCEGCGDCVPNTIAAQLVRVLREALTNVQQHSQARNVTIRLHSSQTLIRLEVEDDGIGFDPARILDSRLGIKIITERMHQLDGSVRYSPVHAGGTLLVAEAPVRPIARAGIPAEMVV